MENLGTSPQILLKGRVRALVVQQRELLVIVALLIKEDATFVIVQTTWLTNAEPLKQKVQARHQQRIRHSQQQDRPQPRTIVQKMMQ